MFFIINRTRRKVSKDDLLTVKSITKKEWPVVVGLGDFVEAGDTIEMIEIATENKAYYGVPYITQRPYTYGMERINADKTDYFSAQEKAQQWLAERLAKTGIVLPHPRCVCGQKAEAESELQSLADTGLCWTCRTPRRDVVVPRPKKRERDWLE